MYSSLPKFLFLLLLCVGLLAGCEKPPAAFTPKDNPFEVVPAQFKQKVLIENFVAEWTSTSLQAAVLTQSLQKDHPEEVIAINLHVNDWLSIPFHENLSDLLGGLIEVPRAAINRLPLGGGGSYTLLPMNAWTSGTVQALKTEAPIAMAIESGLIKTNEGFAQVFIAHKQAISGDLRLFLYLTQNQIPALFQEGAGTAFYHQDVLRDVLPDVNGLPVVLGEEYTEGEIITQKFPSINLQNLDLTQLKLTAVLVSMDPDFRKIRVVNAQQVHFGGNKYWN